MAGIVLRKTMVALLTILKWILQAALVALKLVLGMAKLFLLLLALVMRIVLRGIPKESIEVHAAIQPNHR